MRLVLDCLGLAGDRPEGTTTYVRELCRALDPMLADDDVQCLRWPTVRIPRLANIKTAPSPGLVARIARKATRRPGPKVAAIDTDLVHVPTGFLRADHGGVTAPIVLTVHDAHHAVVPELLSSTELDERHWLLRESVSRAAHIIASSQATADTLADHYRVDPERLTVVPLAARVEPGSPGASTEPFAFYPAADGPRKNHARLFDAWSQLASPPRLVLTGLRTEATLPGLIASFGLDRIVDDLGEVPVATVYRLYRDARLVVYPSLFEGFGLPILEAMAAGTPVVCTDTSSLPEVAGDAAAYCDPMSPASIAAAVAKVWADDGELARLRQLGTERAQLFSWERTARETLAVYTAVLASR